MKTLRLLRKTWIRQSVFQTAALDNVLQQTPCSAAVNYSTGQLKCDGTRAETRFRLSAKQTSPFKSAGASVQSTTGTQGVRISGSNAGYTTFRDSVKSTGYPLHSPISPPVPLPASPCAITFQVESNTGTCSSNESRESNRPLNVPNSKK